MCSSLTPSLRYRIKLDSDEVQYGGHGRLDHNTEFFTEPVPHDGRSHSTQVNTHTPDNEGQVRTIKAGQNNETQVD